MATVVHLRCGGRWHGHHRDHRFPEPSANLLL